MVAGEGFRTKLAQAEAAVATAAEKIALEVGEMLVDQIEALDRARRALLLRLVGLGTVWSVKGPSQAPITLSWRIKGAIESSGEPLRHDERWQGFMKALRDDADAAFDAP